MVEKALLRQTFFKAACVTQSMPTRKSYVQDIAGLARAGCAGAIGRGIAKNAVADADVLLGIKAPLGQQSLALGRFKRLFLRG